MRLSHRPINGSVTRSKALILQLPPPPSPPPYLVRFLVFLSPDKKQDLSQQDGAKENEDHLCVHEVVTPVLLLDHPVPQSMRFLRTKLAPVHLVPVPLCGGRSLGERSICRYMKQHVTWT